MALETNVAQKIRLFNLLIVEKAYLAKNIEIVPELKNAIISTIAEMDEKDVAYVEKQVARL